MLRLPRIEVEAVMWPCLLLKYCVCDGVVSCQSTAPATGLSFWNIGLAALRDLLIRPAPSGNAASVWDGLKLSYASLQRSTAVLPPGVWGFCAARAKTIWRKNAESHGGEAMAATWYVLYFARETEHIEGRKSACALKLRSHTEHMCSFWTVGFSGSNGYLGWSSPAFFGFRSFSLDVY